MDDVWLYLYNFLFPGMGKSVLSLLLITAQGSCRTAPKGRGNGNIAQNSHTIAPSGVDDHRLMMKMMVYY